MMRHNKQKQLLPSVVLIQAAEAEADIKGKPLFAVGQGPADASKHLEPTVETGMFILDASYIKGIARRFACLYPVLLQLAV